MKCMLYCNGYNICFFELYPNDCDLALVYPFEEMRNNCHGQTMIIG